MAQARPFVPNNPPATFKPRGLVDVSRGAAPGGTPPWRRDVVIGSLATLIWSVVELPQPALPLPSYQLSVRGDAPLSDGQPPADATPVRVSWSSALQVVLRPSRDVQSPVEVHAYLVQGTRRLLWPAHFEQAPSGTIHLRQRPQDQPQILPGDWEILFRIEARASSVVERIRTLLFAESHDFQELRTRIYVNADEGS